MKQSTKETLIYSAIIFGIVAGGFLYLKLKNKETDLHNEEVIVEVDSLYQSIKNAPPPNNLSDKFISGKLLNDVSNAELIMTIKEKVLDFCSPSFQKKSNYFFSFYMWKL